MKKFFLIAVCLAAGVFPAPFSARAHFGMVIPSDSMVGPKDPRVLKLEASFSHPFEGAGMDMEKPKVFGALAQGKKTDLTGSLKQTRIMGGAAWRADFAVKRPGAHIFYMEPRPYFEPAEDCFIIHHTKTVAAVFGDDEGWDAEVGLKTEIVPVTRPFGLYAGNLFQGIVKKDGRPVPHARVEVEFYNREKKLRAPADDMITQTVKADANGLFSYAAPIPGWWGFSALTRADHTLKHKGEDKDVELGAVIWVRFHPFLSSD